MSVEISDWFLNLHELPQPDPEKAVPWVGPGGSDRTFTMHAEFTAAHGSESVRVPNLEMRVVKSGTEEVILSNEHQSVALAFETVFRKTGFSVTPRVKGPGSNVFETLHLLRYQRVVASGGTLHLM